MNINDQPRSQVVFAVGISILLAIVLFFSQFGTAIVDTVSAKLFVRSGCFDVHFMNRNL